MKPCELKMRPRPHFLKVTGPLGLLEQPLVGVKKKDFFLLFQTTWTVCPVPGNNVKSQKRGVFLQPKLLKERLEGQWLSLGFRCVVIKN